MSSSAASRAAVDKRHKKTSDPPRSSNQFATTDPYGVTLDVQRSAGNQAVNGVMNSLGVGAPMPIEMRDEMEQRFGENFSNVRMHTDARAAQSATELNAKSYTVGNNIFFNEGHFNPGTTEGKRLLAHELAHVVQQRLGGGPPYPSHEVEADRAAGQVSSNQSANVQSGVEAGSVQRSEIVEFGDAERQWLLDYWRGKLKRARKQENRDRYQTYIDTIEKGERPSWQQSEAEMQSFYKEIGGGGQQVYKSGRKGRWKKNTEGFWLPESASSVPDIILSSASLEVKNYSITNLDNLVYTLKTQISKRATNLPYNIRQQGIILDFRGQDVKETDIQALIERIEAKVGVPTSNIQVVKWRKTSGPNKLVPAPVNAVPPQVAGTVKIEGKKEETDNTTQPSAAKTAQKLPKPGATPSPVSPSQALQNQTDAVVEPKASIEVSPAPAPATIPGPPKKPALPPSPTPSSNATPIKGAPVLAGSVEEGYHLESQQASSEKPLPTASKSAKNPPQPVSPPPPTPSTKALPKTAAPASIQKTAPKPPSAPIVPTKVVKPPQAPKAVLTPPAKESAPTNPSVLKPEPPRPPSAAPHPAELNSLPKAKPPAASAPPPSATLVKGPNNTFNPRSDRRLQKWNEGAIRKTGEYVKNRQNRSSAKEAGAALLGEMLGNALENLNEWGIRNRSEEELAKLKPTLKAYQEAHPNDGVLIAVQIETWDPNWRPSDARPTRNFVSVVPQFGGKTKDEAINRWSTEPKLLAGPSEGSRMGTDFIWIPPGQYVSLSKTNFINGRYVSDSDPTRMLIFQFEDNGAFHCDAVDPRSGGRLRVEVVRGWQLNLNENSLKMTVKFYDLQTKAVIESEFMVLDSEWVQEHWSSDSGRSGNIFWQKIQF